MDHKRKRNYDDDDWGASSSSKNTTPIIYGWFTKFEEPSHEKKIHGGDGKNKPKVQGKPVKDAPNPDDKKDEDSKKTSEWMKEQTRIMNKCNNSGRIRPQFGEKGVQKKTRQVNLRDVVLTCHPKYSEISKFTPNAILFQYNDIGSIYGDSNGSPTATWIDSPEKLSFLASKLQNLDDFTLNLEGHARDSRNGFTALIKIGTRKNGNFLIDAIRLHKFIGPTMKKILESPFPLKVLHAADNDVLNLQRDYDIYLSGIFDVQLLYQKVNGGRPIEFENMAKVFFPNHATMLDNIQTNSDWRIRPLTWYQRAYATNNVHFLMHVYNEMKRICLEHGNEGRAILENVYELSKKKSQQFFNNKEQPLDSMNYEAMAKNVVKSLKNEERCKELISTMSSSHIKILEYLLEWRLKFGLMIDRRDFDILSDRDLLKLAVLAPRTEDEFRRIVWKYSMKCEKEAKQVKIVLAIIDNGEKTLNHLRNVLCTNCLKTGHVPIFCPQGKIKENWKIYMNMPENIHIKQRLGKNRWANWLKNKEKKEEEKRLAANMDRHRQFKKY